MDRLRDRWSVAEAKQRLSAVLRAAAIRPQLIFSRSRLVAAVIDLATFEAFEAWEEESGRLSLGEAFVELRRICVEEGYSLEVGERVNRDDSFVPALEDAPG